MIPVRKAATLLSLCLLGAVQSTAQEVPIRLHPDNPRYFQWQGRATVLVDPGSTTDR